MLLGIVSLKNVVIYNSKILTDTAWNVHQILGEPKKEIRLGYGQGDQKMEDHVLHPSVGSMKELMKLVCARDANNIRGQILKLE